MKGWLAALLYFGVVAAVVVGISFLFAAGEDGSLAANETTTTTEAPDLVDVVAPSAVPGEEPVADAAEVILPSVVHVQTAAGLGSGVVYDQGGLIITAAHVVDGSDEVTIRFTDGTQMKGTVLGTAPQVDIAVIQVERIGLSPATFATDKPRVGQLAVAVGSPWGLESTVTAGIISAVDQTNCSFETCSSMVQTDAAINPGNSGGALVDRHGQVVGINVSIFTESGANDGVGFAVPSSIAIAYADSIVSGVPIETAFLGVEGASVETEGTAGSLIVAVVDGSGAAAAGIQIDDVVIAFDGVPILDWTDLVAQVRAHQPGETVDVIVIREDVEMTLAVTLGTRTEDLS